MTRDEIISLFYDVEFEEYKFKCIEKEGSLFIMALYGEPDIITGADQIQKTRKWYISPYATRSEIVQTMFKCVLTSQEHRTRERFKYKGKRIFGPHFDIDALHKICESKDSFDYRDSTDFIDWSKAKKAEFPNLKPSEEPGRVPDE